VGVGIELRSRVEIDILGRNAADDQAEHGGLTEFGYWVSDAVLITFVSFDASPP